jgi:hypothetical protein
MAPSARRNSSPLAYLINPKEDIPAAERDIRLEDWLNDKLQTTADLDDLAKLIAIVDDQKTQLDRQVCLHSFHRCL